MFHMLIPANLIYRPLSAMPEGVAEGALIEDSKNFPSEENTVLFMVRPCKFRVFVMKI
jgi:hypothetical protein